ncbi:helix-turn-helix domain-containing protein [Paenibacillus rigui]|uniref:HTH luxR-type domain-containing protein n=1 Tax=Paenibacillus rigui TaxID=554312 RepID=A0A229UGY5_9BACL|nr:helix-turn-helix transcriptional regulator [Paenibacillus rigui]OXM82657.1 hypothetical protein CF651_29830 [Paenibacillus rigui]
MIPSQLLPVFEWGPPSCIITSSKDGVPNIANLTRIWYVDGEHVAIANQFLNKTYSNLMEQPLAFMKIANPSDLFHWEIGVRYIRAETDGALFESLLQDIQMISWMAEAAVPAELRSVMIFKVLSLRKGVEESLHLTPSPETYGELLNALADSLGCSRLSYWVPVEGTADVKLLASRGVTGAGVQADAFDSMKRLALLVVGKRQVIRLGNIQSQVRYIHSIRSKPLGQDQPEVPNTLPAGPSSYLAVPILSFDTLIGMICCEASGGQAEAFDRLEDGFLLMLSSKLGETLAASASVAEQDYGPLFRQTIERVRLEWTKASEPFHTELSARERQVAIHVAQGHTNAQIAKILFVSPRTVTTHVERIFQKLQVSSRAVLTRYVMEKGLLTDHPDSDH